MRYRVKEIFYTLQGEGANAGRPAVLCRFSGCNLWSGRERDRANAVCNFCDTDFVGANGVGGGIFHSAEALATSIADTWPRTSVQTGRPLVVMTGGEPLLQLDEAIVRALHQRGFEVALETNGTLPAPQGIDWICVSPKAVTKLVIRSGNELKLVFPQRNISPGQFENLAFDHFFLQPMDNGKYAENLRDAVRFCLEHPRWRLSLQLHKLLGLP
jgi:7-carboxy-7-deazaguanine synthase